MAALVALIVWRSVALWRARGHDLDADSGA
jgi:hypothetical protein